MSLSLLQNNNYIKCKFSRGGKGTNLICSKLQLLLEAEYF